MKKLVLACVLIFAISENVFADKGRPVFHFPKDCPDTTLLSQVLALPLQTYIGKPIDSLFQVLPAAYYKRGFMPSKVGFIKGVFQLYGSAEFNNISVEIYVDTFQFLTVPDRSMPSSSRDMTLAKKETIAFIKVFKNYECVYGCSNPNYWMR
jgi:hypothetical protein